MLDDADRVVADDDDAAVVAVVRGHLELAGITTVDALARRDRARRRAASRTRSPRSNTTASRCRAATPTPTTATSSGSRAACSRACTRTRGAHAAQRDRARDRAGLHAVPAAVAAPRARHAAHGRRRARDRDRAAPGVGGGGRGVGTRAARAPPARVRTPPRSTGSVTTARSRWLRLESTRRATSTRPRARPTRRHPISVLFRDDLAVAARGGRGAQPTRSTRPSAQPPRSSSCCATRGACFAAELVHRDQPAARRHRARAVGRRQPRAARPPTASARSGARVDKGATTPRRRRGCRG